MKIKMRLILVLAAVTLAQAAKLDRIYIPPNAQSSVGSNFLETPHEFNGFQEQTGALSNNRFSNPNAYNQNGGYSDFEASPERAQAAVERNAAILRQDNANNGKTYAYAYKTEKGIYGEENGVATNGVQAQGEYSYTGDDGKVYSVRYTADENGFQPQGDHLPTPPPVPKEILKALEQNARDEAAGIYDDGSYSEGNYNSNSQQQYYINNNAQANNNNNDDSVVTNNVFIRDEVTGSGNSVAGVQKAYLRHFSLRNNVARSGSSVNGIQKAYLPPFAPRNNQKNGVQQPAFNSNDATEKVQKAYLPPFGQRNNHRSEVRQSTFNNNVFARNNAAGNVSSVTEIQKTYLLPLANNRGADIQLLVRNDATERVQKAYLPPFGLRNNDRSVVRQSTFNNNVFSRNNAAESGTSTSFAGIQKAYLPPFGQLNYQKRAVRQATDNSNNSTRNNTSESGSSRPGVNNAYLPPTLSFLQSSLDRLANNRHMY